MSNLTEIRQRAFWGCHSLMYIDLPDPRPLSNNVDLETVWYKEPAQAVVANGAVKENVVDKIALAHHLSDQAETILLYILRDVLQRIYNLLKTTR